MKNFLGAKSIAATVLALAGVTASAAETWTGHATLADGGAPDLAPLWNILDMTPGGRPPTWYASLSYV